LQATASSTTGPVVARSAAGAGAAETQTVAGGNSAFDLPQTTSQVIGIDASNPAAGGDLRAGSSLGVNSQAALQAVATASTTGGSTGFAGLTRGSNVVVNPGTGGTTLRQGDLVRSSTTDGAILADTNYWVKDILFGQVSSVGGALQLSYPTSGNRVTYNNNDIIALRLNDSGNPNGFDPSIIGGISRFGLQLGRQYFVVNANASAGTIQLSEISGGSAILAPSSLTSPVASGLADASRFQLSASPDPTAPALALSAGATGALTLDQISTATAFAGGRPSFLELSGNSDSGPRALVAGILGDGSGSASFTGNGSGDVVGDARALLRSSARSVESAATAGGALDAIGLGGVLVDTAGSGMVRGSATINADASASSTGTLSNRDYGLANLVLNATGIEAGNAAAPLSIGASGQLRAEALVEGNSQATITTGNSTALAAVAATGMLNSGNASTDLEIGADASLTATASLGRLGRGLLASAVSAGSGNAESAIGAVAIGLQGNSDGAGAYNSISVDGGLTQGVVTATAVLDLQATATTGSANTSLTRQDPSLAARTVGLLDLDLNAAAASQIESSATGRAQLSSRSVSGASGATADTETYGILGADAGGRNRLEAGGAISLRALADQQSVARAFSTGGTADAHLTSDVGAILNNVITADGPGNLIALAQAQLRSQSLSVAQTSTASATL
jgi:hypothetical protein